MPFPTIPADLSTLSDEELATLYDELVASFNEAIAPDAEGNFAAMDDETVAALGALTENVETIRTVQTERATAYAARADQIAQLGSRVNVGLEDGDAGEAGEGSTDAGAVTDAATGEGSTDATDSGTLDTGSADADLVDAVTAGAAIAALPIKPVANALTSLRASTPARTRPRPVAPSNIPSIIASAEVPGIASGAPVKDMRQVAELMVERHRTIGVGNNDPVSVVRFNRNIPEDRLFTADMSTAEVKAKLDSFSKDPESIRAAGGICAPVNNYYEQMVIAEAERPFRDSLANFGADRGGLKYNPPPTLASITSGVAVVTAAQDLANATKGAMTVTCAAAVEVDIAAIYNQLKFGNFGARAWPENVEAWQALALAFQARVGEQFLLDQMSAFAAANGTQVTTVANVGAGRELFARLGQAAAGYRNRNRMAPTTMITVALPAWALDLVQTDFARTFTDAPGMISLEQSDILALFKARNIDPVFFIDSKTGGGQIFGAANGGRSSAADGITTSGSPNISSTSGAFSAADVGKTITGSIVGIPAGATISSVTSATAAVISANATATTTLNVFRVGANVLQEFPTSVDTFIYATGSVLHLDGGTLDLGVVRDTSSNSTNQFTTFTENFENLAVVGPEVDEVIFNLVNPDGSYAAARTIPIPILN